MFAAGDGVEKKIDKIIKKGHGKRGDREEAPGNGAIPRGTAANALKNSRPVRRDRIRPSKDQCRAIRAGVHAPPLALSAKSGRAETYAAATTRTFTIANAAARVNPLVVSRVRTSGPRARRLLPPARGITVRTVLCGRHDRAILLSSNPHGFSSLLAS